MKYLLEMGFRCLLSNERTGGTGGDKGNDWCWETFMPFHTNREMNHLHGTRAASDDGTQLPLAA
ncbi:hypothetical protein CCP4SC76_190012 [Gammaproteobacteria bacterium]